MPFRVQRAASVRAEASPYVPTMWGMPSGRACHCESPAGGEAIPLNRTGSRRPPRYARRPRDDSTRGARAPQKHRQAGGGG